MSLNQPSGDPQLNGQQTVSGNSIDVYGQRGLIATGGSGYGVQGLGGIHPNTNVGISTGQGGLYTTPYAPYTITTTDTSGIIASAYNPISLRTILGAEASGFIILPSNVVLGHGSKRYTLIELLKELDDICYMEFGLETAIRPEVHAAIISYMKTGYDFADLGLVEFLKRILGPKDDPEL